MLPTWHNICLTWPIMGKYLWCIEYMPSRNGWEEHCWLGGLEPAVASRPIPLLSWLKPYSRAPVGLWGQDYWAWQAFDLVRTVLLAPNLFEHAQNCLTHLKAFPAPLKSQGVFGVCWEKQSCLTNIGQMQGWQLSTCKTGKTPCSQARCESHACVWVQGICAFTKGEKDPS